MEALLAKIIGPLAEFVKWLAMLLIGLLSWLFVRHDNSIRSLNTKVSAMQIQLAKTVTLENLEEKAKDIRESVASDHQRIYDKVDQVATSMLENQNRALQSMHQDLSACNRAVMDQINGPVMEQISEIRQFIFNHIERRSKDRD